MINKKPRQIESTRVVIIGAGLVGSTTAFTIMSQGIASEIALIDINKKRCEGEALDLQHGLSLTPTSRVWAGDYQDCKDADVVVISAGLGQKPGQSRIELAKVNAKIIADIVKKIKKYTREAIILVVSNPLDVMTMVALKASGFPARQIFGTGTTLDSSRFKFLLAQKLGVAAESVEAFLAGEHGDSEVPVFSHANIMGEPLANIPGYSKKIGEYVYKKTRNAAAEIISKKGATYYAVALSIARLTRAVLYNENSVFPVSVLLTGQYGLKNLCLSLPAVIGRRGIARIFKPTLNKTEIGQLKKSAKIIEKTFKDLKI